MAHSPRRPRLFKKTVGCDRIGPTRRGKGTKIMVIADGKGIPLASEAEAANHAEVNLIKPLIDAR